MRRGVVLDRTKNTSVCGLDTGVMALVLCANLKRNYVSDEHPEIKTGVVQKNLLFTSEMQKKKKR